ncbi:SRPBCC family protein [Actinosynnema sp. NPDC050436]|uniref:SRPBCC family protein n=1 Tax=Actinosynnema sp. NPDC050436 TaxID=3155659 RepID=UPI0033C922BA
MPVDGDGVTCPPATTTSTRLVPADAEAVFDVVTDLDHLSSWLPPGAEVERYGPHLVRLWTTRADEPFERVVAVDWENLRVRWGSEATPAYTGRLSVLRLSAGHSAVTLDITGPAGVLRLRLEQWAERALNNLCAVALAEPRHVIAADDAAGDRAVHGCGYTPNR